MKNKIVVLLSTWNGEKHLQEQLDSLNSQTYKDFKIIARDDMGSDNTLQILKDNNIEILESSKNLGSKKSFSVLLEYAFNNTEYEYIMFCDQDDVWKEDKIEKTLTKMHEMENKFGKVPLLVHTDLEVVDENLNTLSSSMWGYEYTLPQYNSLNRLLIQNTVTGCTVMINKELAKKCLSIPNEAIMHDWWIGLVTSYFGEIGYLDASTIKYRQHGKNTIGAKGFQVNALSHLLGLIKSLIFKSPSYINNMQENIAQAKAFLKQFENELDTETVKMLQEFTMLEQKTFWEKRIILWKYRLYKQGFIRNSGLFLKI